MKPHHFYPNTRSANAMPRPHAPVTPTPTPTDLDTAKTPACGLTLCECGQPVAHNGDCYPTHDEDDSYRTLSTTLSVINDDQCDAPLSPKTRKELTADAEAAYLELNPRLKLGHGLTASTEPPASTLIKQKVKEYFILPNEHCQFCGYTNTMDIPCLCVITTHRHEQAPAAGAADANPAASERLSLAEMTLDETNLSPATTTNLQADTTTNDMPAPGDEASASPATAAEPVLPPEEIAPAQSAQKPTAPPPTQLAVLGPLPPAPIAVPPTEQTAEKTATSEPEPGEHDMTYAQVTEYMSTANSNLEQADTTWNLLNSEAMVHLSQGDIDTDAASVTTSGDLRTRKNIESTSILVSFGDAIILSSISNALQKNNTADVVASLEKHGKKLLTLSMRHIHGYPSSKNPESWATFFDNIPSNLYDSIFTSADAATTYLKNYVLLMTAENMKLKLCMRTMANYFKTYEKPYEEKQLIQTINIAHLRNCLQENMCSLTSFINNQGPNSMDGYNKFARSTFPTNLLDKTGMSPHYTQMLEMFPMLLPDLTSDSTGDMAAAFNLVNKFNPLNQTQCGDLMGCLLRLTNAYKDFRNNALITDLKLKAGVDLHVKPSMLSTNSRNRGPTPSSVNSTNTSISRTEYLASEERQKDDRRRSSSTRSKSGSERATKSARNEKTLDKQVCKWQQKMRKIEIPRVNEYKYEDPPQQNYVWSNKTIYQNQFIRLRFPDVPAYWCFMCSGSDHDAANCYLFTVSTGGKAYINYELMPYHFHNHGYIHQDDITLPAYVYKCSDEDVNEAYRAWICSEQHMPVYTIRKRIDKLKDSTRFDTIKEFARYHHKKYYDKSWKRADLKDIYEQPLKLKNRGSFKRPRGTKRTHGRTDDDKDDKQSKSKDKGKPSSGTKNTKTAAPAGTKKSAGK